MRTVLTAKIRKWRRIIAVVKDSRAAWLCHVDAKLPLEAIKAEAEVLDSVLCGIQSLLREIFELVGAVNNPGTRPDKLGRLADRYSAEACSLSGCVLADDAEWQLLQKQQWDFYHHVMPGRLVEQGKRLSGLVLKLAQLSSQSLEAANRLANRPLPRLPGRRADSR
eukprot:jgi/Ulvmu1/3087/UM015_0127.1